MKEKHTIITIAFILFGAIAVQAQQCNLKRAAKGKLYGFKDASDAWVIKPVFSDVQKFDTTYNVARVAIIEKKEEKYGYIDCKGNFVIPPIYEMLYSYTTGGIIAKKDGKYGVIDLQNNVILPFENRKIDKAGEDLFQFSEHPNRKSLYKGKDKIGEYNVIMPFKDGIMTVENDKFGVVSLDGKELIPPITDYIGTTVIKAWYGSDFTKDNIFVKGTASYRISEKWGLIDSWGNIIIDATTDKACDEIGSDHLGLLRVKKDNKWGFIDRLGNVKIPFIYEYADNFYEYYAAVKQINGKYGFIDATGKEVLPFIYDKAYSFMKNTASVVLNGKSETIDATGKVVIYQKPTTNYLPNGEAHTYCVCIELEKKSVFVGYGQSKYALFFVQISDKTGSVNEQKLFDVAKNKLWVSKYVGMPQLSTSIYVGDCVSYKQSLTQRLRSGDYEFIIESTVVQ